MTVKWRKKKLVARTPRQIHKFFFLFSPVSWLWLSAVCCVCSVFAFISVFFSIFEFWWLLISVRFILLVVFRWFCRRYRRLTLCDRYHFEITLCCTYTNLLIRQMSSFSLNLLSAFFVVVFMLSARYTQPTNEVCRSLGRRAEC